MTMTMPMHTPMYTCTCVGQARGGQRQRERAAESEDSCREQRRERHGRPAQQAARGAWLILSPDDPRAKVHSRMRTPPRLGMPPQPREEPARLTVVDVVLVFWLTALDSRF